MLFLRIIAVESLRIRGIQNSSARTCESNKGVFSNLVTSQLETQTLGMIELLNSLSDSGIATEMNKSI